MKLLNSHVVHKFLCSNLVLHVILLLIFFRKKEILIKLKKTPFLHYFFFVVTKKSKISRLYKIPQRIFQGCHSIKFCFCLCVYLLIYLLYLIVYNLISPMPFHFCSFYFIIKRTNGCFYLRVDFYL